MDRRENEGGVAADLPKPSNEKVKAWMAKIKAKKAEATGGQHGDINSTAATGDGGSYTSHKRRRDEQQRVNEADDARSDDMELDDDLDDGQASAGQYLLPAAAGMHQPPLPPLPPPREDVPLVALRRERLRIACLERFVRENEQYGTMRGYSKTSRSCRDEGMFVGLGGMLGRCVVGLRMDGW